jgi:hypothetical protein
MNCWVAVGEGYDDFLREPCSFLCDIDGDSEDGGVLVFRAYAGEVFRYGATVDVMTKVFCCEVVCLKFICIIYCFV